ncbi:MAG TPA: helix-turn-helix domain-containing protein [Steroidobacteraceae bacterium]|nr:helix-turn-helix domain-containing protein [Steroidobacteraceae bacterium]
MARKPTVGVSSPRHISVVVVPDSTVSTLFGIYDILSFVERQSQASSGSAPFHVELVGETKGLLALASGVTVEVQRSIDTIDATDVMIVPSVDIGPHGWKKGRYPRVIDWVREMHEGGTVLCSACLGIFLLAESGLFDGRDATVHFDAAGIFAATYPAIPIHPERVLMISGAREELVSSGASVAWHDLALHLIARYAGSAAAHDAARAFALQWHHEGFSPYVVFDGKRDHGDADIAGAQKWLGQHFSVANPVEEMLKRSKLAERTFKRRFVSATGLAPIAYVQRLRIEDAKKRLERTDAPVDEISWRVGYEDPAFFRRLFKRTTGLAPAAYRKRFRIPDFVQPRARGRRSA